MVKIIIATHHRLAYGFKDTIEYLLPNTVEIIDINAYIENISIENQIKDALSKFSKDEQIFVFTDILSGSVNQQFVKYINDYNIELITGVNLILIMEIVLSLDDKKMTKEKIKEIIQNASSGIVYVNEKICDLSINGEDD